MEDWCANFLVRGAFLVSRDVSSLGIVSNIMMEAESSLDFERRCGKYSLSF
jgi:hypothetical protein